MQETNINTNGVTMNFYGQTTINIYNAHKKDEGKELCKAISYSCGYCRHCKTEQMMQHKCSTCYGTTKVDDKVKDLIGFLECNNWEINPDAYIINRNGEKVTPIEFINDWKNK